MTPLIGEEAVRVFLGTLKPKDNNGELWFKLDHDHFYVTELTEKGLENSWDTKKNSAGDRIRTKRIPDLIAYLLEKSEKEDGGVFYVPKQPIGGPLKECVLTSDDIGIEMDNESFESQLKKYKNFTDITGLDFASLLKSGGESIHGHLKLIDHVDIKDNLYLNRLVVIALQADPVTAREWQPMRVPGFFRKEKEAYQELLYYSDARYSYDEILKGLQEFYYQWGVEMPPYITEEWWTNCIWRVLKKKDISARDKDFALRRNLNAGIEGYEKVIEAERIKRRDKLEIYEQRRASVTDGLGKSLVDVVRETCVEMGSNPFELDDRHNWNFDHTGNKARGACLWHDSGSGNSAWLSGKYDSWTYHCPVCTNDKPLDAFDYWRLQKCGLDENGALPKVTGWEWVEYAKMWLTENKVEIPEFTPDLASIKEVIAQIKEVPPAPELDLLKLDESELPWHERLEEACRVLLQQDRESVRVYYHNEIRKHFNVTDQQVRSVCNDVNVFQRENPTHIGDRTFDTLNALEHKRLNPGINGYRTGSQAIDTLSNGFSKDDLIVIAGPSSTGKTLLLKQLALSIASNYKSSENCKYIPHVFNSAESSTAQIIHRLISQEAYIEISRLTGGFYDDVERERIFSSAQRIAESNLFIDGTPNISTSQIRHKLNRLRDQYGAIGSIWIDHFLKIAKPYPNDDNASYSQIARELKLIQKEFGCPMIVLAQLTSAHEARNDHRPIEYDVKYGKTLVEECDKLFMLYRPEKWSDKGDEKGLIHIYGRKVRDGDTGMVIMEADLAHMIFKDIPGESFVKPIVAAKPPEPEEEEENYKYRTKKTTNPEDLDVNYF